MNWKRAGRRVGLAVAAMAVVAALGPILAVEGLYRYGVRSVGEMPSPPEVRASPEVLRALWDESGDREFVVEPKWPWDLLRWFERGRRVNGERSTTRAARLWLQQRNLAGGRILRWHLRYAATSVWLSRHWTAAQLAQERYDLEYFGRDAFGLEEAAAKYFCKWPEELAPSELALLLGVLASPGAYSPDLYPEAALKRRTYVLGRLVELGLVSPEESEREGRCPLGVVPAGSCLVPPGPRESRPATDRPR